MLETASRQLETDDAPDSSTALRPVLRRPQAMREALEKCLAACAICERTCNVYADTHLSELERTSSIHCIREALRCAEVSSLLARVVVETAVYDIEALQVPLESCANVCDTCEAQCRNEDEADERQRRTAEACRRCAECCREVLRELSARSSYRRGECHGTTPSRV